MTGAAITVERLAEDYIAHREAVNRALALLINASEERTSILNRLTTMQAESLVLQPGMDQSLAGQLGHLIETANKLAK